MAAKAETQKPWDSAVVALSRTKAPRGRTDTARFDPANFNQDAQMIDIDKLTNEQKVALAAGPKNVRNLVDSSRMNAKVAACAPPPRPTRVLTREMMIPQQR